VRKFSLKKAKKASRPLSANLLPKKSKKKPKENHVGFD